MPIGATFSAILDLTTLMGNEAYLSFLADMARTLWTGFLAQIVSGSLSVAILNSYGD